MFLYENEREEMKIENFVNMSVLILICIENERKFVFNLGYLYME